MNIIIERLPLHPTDSDVFELDYLVKQLSSHSSATFVTIFNCQHLDSGIVFVARDTDTKKIVGTASLVFVRKLTGQYAQIETVVVDKEYRGNHIAEKLMQELIAQALLVGGIRYVDLTSNPNREAARALYKKLGFVQRDTNVYRLLLG